MRVTVNAGTLGDTTRHVAFVTDSKSLAVSATIEGGDHIAALEMLELRLGEALQAVRDERVKLELEAA